MLLASAASSPPPLEVLRKALHGLKRRGVLAYRRQAAGVLAAVWLIYYANCVQRIQLHYGTSSKRGSSAAQGRLKQIAARCRTLAGMYWPTFYAPNAPLQFLVLGFKELIARAFRSPYSREVLTLRDGEKIALDWVAPSPAADDGMKPACILLHGAFQDSTSATMMNPACALAAHGNPVVVMNRRGYGGITLEGQEPQLHLFGLDEDLDEVLLAVGKRYPGRPVAVVGFSCGSGFSGRYVGNRSKLSVWGSGERTAPPPGQLPRLLCGVAYDPGYDVSPEGAVAKIRFPYNFVLGGCLKFFYVFRHRGSLRRKSESLNDLVSHMLHPKNLFADAVDTYRKHRRLAGTDGSSAWLELQQPRIEKVQVPMLCINSRDDPICVWGNVEANWKAISSNPNVVLAELQRGAHGCKFDFFGYTSLADRMIVDFVDAAWQQHLQERTSPAAA
eukprot:TRINITY_DN39274_c0_g1_i1.p1 TRINITY_DN39274_c0_g1~~TRINITY_DN39274_c0_g1_i1.p1  ORF type:complete len:445 (+),score=86.19 TRINITY_DN39274_c0_g1_i1:55-1389(+)